MEDGCSKRFDVDFAFDEQPHQVSNNETGHDSLRASYLPNSIAYSPPLIPPSKSPYPTSSSTAEFENSSGEKGPHWAS